MKSVVPTLMMRKVRLKLGGLPKVTQLPGTGASSRAVYWNKVLENDLEGVRLRLQRICAGPGPCPRQRAGKIQCDPPGSDTDVTAVTNLHQGEAGASRGETTH